MKAWDRNEFARTPSQIQRIRNLGGIVAPFPPTQKCNTSRNYPEKWRYIIPRMTGGDFWPGTDGVVGVALATDMMGATQETAPRFGPDAAGCPALDPPNSQASKLAYPFPAEDGSGWFWPQVTGSRMFDFNEQGLAHVGLLPDLLADIRYDATNKTWGMTATERNPIYRSAEAYIRMWERIQNADVIPPPAVTASVSGVQGPGGWYTSDVTVSWDIDIDVRTKMASSTGCETLTISADTSGRIVTCRVTDTNGGDTAASVVIRRDATPPVIAAAERLTAANARGWNNDAVLVRFSATDAMSGIAGHPSVTVTVAGEGVNQQARATFRDRAGNATEATLDGINIDRTAPRLGFRFASLPENATRDEIRAEQARWHRGTVVLVVAAADDLSGLASRIPDARHAGAARGRRWPSSAARPRPTWPATPSPPRANR